MKNYIVEYINKNFKSIVIISLCIAIGLVVGFFVYQFSNQDVKIELLTGMKNTLDISKNEGFESINVIKNGVISNSIITSLIYISAITLVAPAFLCVLSLLKGFVVGVYIPTIFQIFGFTNGILVTLLIIIIPNIIYIPSFIYMCVNSINFHYNIFESKNNKISVFIVEMYYILISFSVMFLSVILEQFLCRATISMYKNMS